MLGGTRLLGLLARVGALPLVLNHNLELSVVLESLLRASNLQLTSAVLLLALRRLVSHLSGTCKRSVYLS